MRHRLFTVPQHLLILLVKGYRLFLSAWIGSVCRFTPSCSAYALQALEAHGAAGGSYLSLRRLARCHPWCRGGHDPVPPVLPPLAPARWRAWFDHFLLRQKTRP